MAARKPTPPSQPSPMKGEGASTPSPLVGQAPSGTALDCAASAERAGQDSPASKGGLRQLRVGGEGVKSEVLNMVSVRVNKKHAASRWRAGLCFTNHPRVVSVTDEVLAQLQADPLLVVDEAFTPPSQPIRGSGATLPASHPIEGEGATTPSPLVAAGMNSPSPLRGGGGDGVDLAQGVTQAPTTEG